MQYSEKSFGISQLAMLTGLTDRTIRNYLSAGILQGEKVDGVWHFSPEQVELFTAHPAVRPSILAKNNSLVYDFLLDGRKAQPEVCMILDIPGGDREGIASFFCTRINERPYKNMHFTFDAVGAVPRVILKGEAAAVLSLIQEFREATEL